MRFQLFQVIPAVSVKFPPTFFNDLPAQDVANIMASTAFVVTDIAPDGTLELEYSNTPLHNGWVYLRESDIL